MHFEVKFSFITNQVKSASWKISEAIRRHGGIVLTARDDVIVFAPNLWRLNSPIQQLPPQISLGIIDIVEDSCSVQFHARASLVRWRWSLAIWSLIILLFSLEAFTEGKPLLGLVFAFAALLLLPVYYAAIVFTRYRLRKFLEDAIGQNPVQAEKPRQTEKLWTKRVWVCVAVGLCVVLACRWFVLPHLPLIFSRFDSGDHPLYTALMNGDVQAVQKRLRKHPDELEHRFSWSSATPLHIAAVRGDTDMIVFLLSLGADIDAKAYRRRGTPLHSAAACGHASAIKVLVEHGADVMARDSHWRTPLHAAASGDHVDAITILLRLGANINAVEESDMSTPLQEAVYSEQINATRVLLEHGALADLDALIDQKERDLAHVPLASKEAKDKYRELIALLKEYKRKRTAERPATYLQSESASQQGN